MKGAVICMSDPSNNSTFYDQYSKALAKANERNKHAVFNALATLGVTSVAVEFDGEGDSGQIHEVTAQAGVSPSELPSAPVKIHAPAGTNNELVASEATLRDAIETLCYEYLAL